MRRSRTSRNRTLAAGSALAAAGPVPALKRSFSGVSLAMRSDGSDFLTGQGDTFEVGNPQRERESWRAVVFFLEMCVSCLSSHAYKYMYTCSCPRMVVVVVLLLLCDVDRYRKRVP